MKKTKELENTENALANILIFESLQDAEKFYQLAIGRTFCNKGERIQDICEDEIENYVCQKSGNLLLKWYLHHKKKQNKGKLLLERRQTSVIRSLAIYFIQNTEILDEKELIKQVKEHIISLYNNYKKQLKNKEKMKNQK